MTEEFPSNSRNAKKAPEERPKVERVVTGEVTRRKKSIGRRLGETFFGSDDARGVLQYLAQDVVVPMTKDLITDFITLGVERTLYGEVRGRGSTVRNRSNSSYVPYNRYTQAGVQEAPQRDISSRGRSQHQFDELVYQSKAEADEVLDELLGTIDKYGVATVADFYQASGVSGQFVDQNHGWLDLSSAGIIRVRGGGFAIKFPPTTDKLR